MGPATSLVLNLLRCTYVHRLDGKRTENSNKYNKKEKYEKSYTMHRIRVGRTVRVGPSVANHYHNHHHRG